MKLFALIVLLVGVLAVDPPVYNYAYHISYDETFVVDKVAYRVNGQKYYDPANNR